MTLSSHAAIGMVVATATRNPLLGFFGAAISHYLADMVPHGDEFLYLRHKYRGSDLLSILVSACDLFVLVVMLLAVLNSRQQHDPLLIIAGTIGGIMPDLLMLIQRDHKPKPGSSWNPLAWLQNGTWWLIGKHYAFHKACHDLIRTPIGFRTGVLYQAALLIGFFVLFIA